MKSAAPLSVRRGLVLSGFSRFRLLAVLALGGLLGGPVVGEETDAWPGFRGPAGSGVCESAKVPVRFSEAEFTWRIPLPGKGVASPAVWGGTIFLTAAEGQQSRHVLAYSAKDGKERWRWTEGFAVHNKHNFNEFASSSPCLDRERVYVFWTSGAEAEALALTHEGKVAWRQTLGAFRGDHGSASSPVLHAGVLFLFWDDADKKQTEYAGLNPSTGAFVWRKTLAWPASELKTSYSTPAVRTSAKGQAEVIVTSMPFGVQSIDPRTGAVLWSYNHGVKERTVGSPVVADGIVFAAWGSGNGAKDHVALVPGTETASGKPEVAWRWTKPDGNADSKGIPYVPTPLAHQGLLYFWGDSGLLEVVEARSGQVVYGPERVEGRFFSSPLLLGEHLYCASRDKNEMVVVKAGRQFELISRNPLGSGVNATPAVAQGALIIRTDTELIRVGGEK